MIGFLKDALTAGLSHEQFWDYTPLQITMSIEAYWRRQGREWENHAWSAWHSAAFQRSKRMPPFKELIGKDKARTEDQMAKLLGSINNG